MPKTARGLDYVIDDFRPPWAATRLPVIFNHGIGTNRDIWAAWVPVIAAERKVVRFDMRGFGQSVCPSEDHAWSMDELVQDLWEIADQAGTEKVHLMGESMGGTIVLAAAVAHPERVASVSISNASFKGKGIGELAYWRDQFAQGGPAGWSRRMMDNRFAPGAGDPAALAWFEQEQAKTKPHVAIGLGSVLARSDLTQELRGLHVPVSITLPDSSPFVPVAHGAELKEIAPNARLRVVPGVRHGLPFSHAQEEAQELLRFLNAMEG
ncbi:alpha/beta fold hydrolase [Rhodoligotrophos ferricapiens]|uniref:alpha/beta fold hydrolase n=1 Tax=Rhodoligotrophos ferricapiens TaxID=3069264 RepID=UPI00315C7F3F